MLVECYRVMGIKMAIHAANDGRLIVSHTGLVVVPSVRRPGRRRHGHNSDEASVAQVPIKSRPPGPARRSVP
jgi:hypothetical protein